MKRKAIATFVMAMSFLVAGCSESVPPSKGVYMLIDTSGTYTEQLDKAKAIINYLLTDLTSGDSLAVARIDSGSFSEKDIIARMSFDARPSHANEQKRKFKDTIDQFATSVKGSAHTDITGGLLQATEWLNEIGVGHKTVIIFSDLEEDLQQGHVRDFPIELDGFEVVALNVTKLNKDNVDPRFYLDRLEYWKDRVEQGGGTFRVVNDLDRVEKELKL